MVVAGWGGGGLRGGVWAKHLPSVMLSLSVSYPTTVLVLLTSFWRRGCRECPLRRHRRWGPWSWSSPWLAFSRKIYVGVQGGGGEGFGGQMGVQWGWDWVMGIMDRLLWRGGKN